MDALNGGLNISVRRMDGSTDKLLHGFDERNGRSRRFTGLGSRFAFPAAEAFCVPLRSGPAVGGVGAQLADVPDADYFEACKLTDLLGLKLWQCSHAGSYLKVAQCSTQ